MVGSAKDYLIDDRPGAGETASMPLVIQAMPGRRDLAALLEGRRQEYAGLLQERGALLFRGFNVYDVGAFDRAMAAFTPQRMDYVYRSSPRTLVGTGVFTATEYPPEQTIGLHNENAFQHCWPRMIAFCCLRPAGAGGETPIADMRRVTRRMGAELLDRFEQRRVRYVRHYHPHVDLPWQSVFQVADRPSLAAFCARHGIEHAWVDDEVLRTEQVCQGVAVHAQTGERLWFNQAHMFHSASLGAEAERSLIACFGRDRLPRHACYGDGEEIGAEVISAVRAAFEAEAVLFKWETADVLLLDNMLTAHGRRPYKGDRRVITALLEPSTV